MQFNNYESKVIRDSFRNQSLSWEIQKDWEKEVASPVCQYMLAPRQAKAILVMIGKALSSDAHFEDILTKIELEYLSTKKQRKSNGDN